MGKYKTITALALLVGILPPLWAVLSGHIGITVGAVALITAGIYGANHNQRKDAGRISLGLLAGDIWAFVSCTLIAASPWDKDVTTFFVLFLFGVMAVFTASLLEEIFFLPAWLGGWAIGMVVMGPADKSQMISLAIQTGVAMLVGIWYVGVFLDMIHQRIIGKNS